MIEGSSPSTHTKYINIDMKTYKETLKHIALNKHQFIDNNSVFNTQNNLNLKLDLVAYIFNLKAVDVINDFADIK